MKLLCIDTSSNTESVALTSEHNVVASLSKFRPRGHASGLLSDLNEILVRSNWHWSDIDGIAIGLGPGGFTSLRVGLSTAKCLAYGLKKPLYSATTLDLIAQNFTAKNVVTLIDAKRGELYVDTPTAGLQCVAPEHLDRYFSPAGVYFFCGDGASKYRHLIETRFAESSFNDDPRKDVPEAAHLSMLIDRENPDNISTLQPQYVRPSDAELTYPDGFPDAVTQFRL